MSLYPFQSKLLNVQTTYFYCLIIYRDRDNFWEKIIIIVLGFYRVVKTVVSFKVVLTLPACILSVAFKYILILI